MDTAHPHPPSRRGAFSLVEVLIVVVVLSILAAVIIPRFTDPAGDARRAALDRDVKMLLSQIQLYAAQHYGRFPGEGSTDPQVFKDALLLSSDADGTTGPPGTKLFGPYIVGQFPPNPFNGGRGVRIVTDIDRVQPDPRAKDAEGEVIGWIYSPVTGRLKPNAPPE